MNMTISDLIARLKEIRKQHGDIQVRIDSLSHTWTPDMAVRERAGEKVLVLNS